MHPAEAQTIAYLPNIIHGLILQQFSIAIGIKFFTELFELFKINNGGKTIFCKVMNLDSFRRSANITFKMPVLFRRAFDFLNSGLSVRSA
jgi:hypothetical protein